MQWDKLKTYYFVAKFQSITKAAQYLNISQPAVSKQMIELERQFGYKMFKKLPKGLVLTRQGQILFENAEQMLRYSELAVSQIQEEQTEPQGNLSLGTNVGLVDTWLYQIIPDFLKQYPHINLSLYSKDTPIDVESLEVQVALQPYSKNQPDLVQNFLMSWNRKLYASKDYLKNNGVPKSVEELSNHQLIGFGPEKIHLFANINWHLSLSDNKSVQKPYVYTNSLRMLFHLGNCGMGIISFSQESPLLKESNFIEVLPEIEGPQIDIYFTYPKQLKNVKKIEVLEAYLKEYIQKHHAKYISPKLA